MSLQSLHSDGAQAPECGSVKSISCVVDVSLYMKDYGRTGWRYQSNMRSLEVLRECNSGYLLSTFALRVTMTPRQVADRPNHRYAEYTRNTYTTTIMKRM